MDSSFKHFRGSLLKSFISRSHLKVSRMIISFAFRKKTAWTIGCSMRTENGEYNHQTFCNFSGKFTVKKEILTKVYFFYSKRET